MMVSPYFQQQPQFKLKGRRNSGREMDIREVTVESGLGFQQDWECSDNPMIREGSASVSAPSANLAVSPYCQQQLQRNVEGIRNSGRQMDSCGVTLESEFRFQRDRGCSDNSLASLVVSPYSQQQRKLSDGFGINFKSQMRNKRKRPPKAKAKPIVMADGKVVSPYFPKKNQGEGEFQQQPQLSHGFGINSGGEMDIREVTVESEFGFQQDWECSDNSMIREGSASVSAPSANLVVSPDCQQQPRRNVEGIRNSGREMDICGVTLESEFRFQRDRGCSDNSLASLVVSPYSQQQRQLSDGFGINMKSQMSNKRKRPPKAKAKPIVTADGKVVSPYFPNENQGEGEFQQQPQLSHGFGINTKSHMINKRKTLPKAKAKPIVTADGKVVSPYFPKKNQGEGEGEGDSGIAIISSNNKVQAKAQAPTNQRLVSPYFPHGKKDFVVASNSKTKASRHFQLVASKSITKASRHFEAQQHQIPFLLKKQNGDNASMNIKKLVSPYFPHEIDDVVVVSKATLKKKKEKKKKEKNDAYLRKSPDNAWIPPKSVHALLQEIYYEDPWKVLVICVLLNKTSGNQAKRVIHDLFELCPNAEAATMVERKEIVKVIRSLGLQNQRSKKIKLLSENYLKDDWTHVDDLPGVGKYAADAYAIFCTGNWKNVVPDDHKLVPYWLDLWKS